MELFEKDNGTETVVVSDIWAGKLDCTRCGSLCDHYLYRKTDRAYLLYVMIGDQTKERYIVCDKCGFSRKINKEEFDRLKKRQNERLLSGAFPVYVMKRDFSPKQVKLPRKLLAFFMACVFISACICWCIDLTMNNSIDAALFGCWAILTVIPAIPLYVTAKELITALRYRKLYRSALSK